MRLQKLIHEHIYTHLLVGPSYEGKVPIGDIAETTGVVVELAILADLGEEREGIGELAREFGCQCIPVCR